jgi:hypothetical protein
VATTAAPDGVILDVAVRGAEGSPSQERLIRIAAMLRDAEQAMPLTAPRAPRDRRETLMGRRTVGGMSRASRRA